MSDNDLFAGVAAITAWLDGSNPVGAPGDSIARHALKITEETGEVAAALAGLRGWNPRKGVTHTLEDLEGELADVALAAMTALQHLTQNADATRAVLETKIQKVIARSGIRPLALVADHDV